VKRNRDNQAKNLHCSAGFSLKVVSFEDNGCLFDKSNGLGLLYTGCLLAPNMRNNDFLKP